MKKNNFTLHTKEPEKAQCPQSCCNHLFQFKTPVKPSKLVTCPKCKQTAKAEEFQILTKEDIASEELAKEVENILGGSFSDLPTKTPEEGLNYHKAFRCLSCNTEYSTEITPIICSSCKTQAKGDFLSFYKVETTRFGDLQIAEKEIISFPEGLAGFPGNIHFFIHQRKELAPFIFLQALDNPNLSFLMVPPKEIHEDYDFKILPKDLKCLGVGPKELRPVAFTSLENLLVFCIVNMEDEFKDWTANFNGPIIIKEILQRGVQVVIEEKKWSLKETIHPEILNN
ncbi:MAG: flagellar assembly protein FliW [SAR324 cluster bacterium]|nr:flagellar assembly protein FliW [SAR324 cluster bacterium]